MYNIMYSWSISFFSVFYQIKQALTNCSTIFWTQISQNNRKIVLTNWLLSSKTVMTKNNTIITLASCQGPQDTYWLYHYVLLKINIRYWMITTLKLNDGRLSTVNVMRVLRYTCALFCVTLRATLQERY